MMTWWAAQPLMKQFFLVMAVPSTVILLIQSVMTFAGLAGGSDADGMDAGGADGGLDTDGMDGGFDAADMDGGGFDAGGLDAGGLDADGVDAADAGFLDAHDALHAAGHGPEPGHAGHGLDGFRFFTVRGIIAFLAVFGWLGAAMTGSLNPLAVFFIAFAGGLLAMTLIGLSFWAIIQLQAKGNLDYRYSVGLQGEVYLPIPAQRAGLGKVMITLQERLIEVDAITDETERLATGTRIRVVGLDGNNVLLVSKEWEGHTHELTV